MAKEVIVSINCITYNHENYIADTIESFLMQKTNFDFEILIHDDASIDRTADIIREYETKYPMLIKPIYQTENQYSKGVRVERFNRERAKGKYIAICEGDDFWTDPNKLQKQVDYMEAHPECSLCVHSAYKVYEDGTAMNETFRPFLSSTSVSVEEILGRWLFPTNSIMCRAALLKEALPRFYESAPCGDFPLTVYLALQGEVYYIDEPMSTYRVFAKNSMTSKIFKEKNTEKRKHFENRFTTLLKEINEYTEFKYSAVIEEAIRFREFSVLVDECDIEKIKSERYKLFFDKLNKKEKASLYMRKYTPCFYKKIYELRRKIINARNRKKTVIEQRRTNE